MSDSDFSDVGETAAPRNVITDVTVLYLGDGMPTLSKDREGVWFRHGLLGAFGEDGLELVKNDKWSQVKLGKCTTIHVSEVEGEQIEGEVLTLVAPTQRGATNALMEIDVLMDSEPWNPKQYTLLDNTPVSLMWCLGRGATPEMEAAAKAFWDRNEDMLSGKTPPPASPVTPPAQQPQQPAPQPAPSPPPQPVPTPVTVKELVDHYEKLPGEQQKEPAPPAQQPTSKAPTPAPPAAEPKKSPAVIPPTPPTIPPPTQQPARTEPESIKPSSPPKTTQTSTSPPPASQPEPKDTPSSSSEPTAAPDPGDTEPLTSAPDGAIQAFVELVGVSGIKMQGTIQPNVYAVLQWEGDDEDDKLDQDNKTPVAFRNCNPIWHHMAASRYLVSSDASGAKGNKSRKNVVVHRRKTKTHLKLVVFEKRLMRDNILAESELEIDLDGILGGETSDAPPKALSRQLRGVKIGSEGVSADLRVTLYPGDAAEESDNVVRNLHQQPVSAPSALQVEVANASLTASVGGAGSYYIKLVEQKGAKKDNNNTMTTQVVFNSHNTPCWHQKFLTKMPHAAATYEVLMCKSVGTDRNETILGRGTLNVDVPPALVGRHHHHHQEQQLSAWRTKTIRFAPVAEGVKEPKFEKVGQVVIKTRCGAVSSFENEVSAKRAEYRRKLHTATAATPASQEQQGKGGVETIYNVNVTIVKAINLVPSNNTGKALSDVKVTAVHSGDVQEASSTVPNVSSSQQQQQATSATPSATAPAVVETPINYAFTFPATHHRHQLLLSCTCPSFREWFMGQATFDVDIPPQDPNSSSSSAAQEVIDLGGEQTIHLQPHDGSGDASAADGDGEELRAQDIALLNKIGRQNFGSLVVQAQVQILRVPVGGNILRVNEMKVLSTIIPRDAREPPSLDALELGCVFAQKLALCKKRKKTLQSEDKPEVEEGEAEDLEEALAPVPTTSADIAAVPANWEGSTGNPLMVPCAFIGPENPLRILLRKKPYGGNNNNGTTNAAGSPPAAAPPTTATSPIQQPIAHIDLQPHHLTTKTASGKVLLTAIEVAEPATADDTNAKKGGKGGTAASNNVAVPQLVHISYEVVVHFEWVRDDFGDNSNLRASMSGHHHHHHIESISPMLWTVAVTGIANFRSGDQYRCAIAPAEKKVIEIDPEDSNEEEDTNSGDDDQVFTKTVLEVDAKQRQVFTLSANQPSTTVFGPLFSTRTLLKVDGPAGRFAALDMDMLVQHGSWPTGATTVAEGGRSGLADVAAFEWAHGNMGVSEADELERRKTEESAWRASQPDPGTPIHLKVGFVTQTVNTATDYEPNRVLCGTVTKLRGRVYLYGGVNEVGMTESSICRFNIRNSKWEQLNMDSAAVFTGAPGMTMPSRHGHTAAVIGSTIYYYGGVGYGGFDPCEVVDEGYRRLPGRLGYLNDIWAFDTENMTLNAITTGGGEHEQMRITQQQSGQQSTNSSKEATEPYRWLHSAIGYNGNMIVFGGMTITVKEQKVMQSNIERGCVYTAVEEYCQTMSILKTPQFLEDGETICPPFFEWENLRPEDMSGIQPSPRSGHSADLWENKMVVFGGKGPDCSFNTLYTCDLDTYEWQELLPLGQVMPPPMDLHASCVTKVGGSPCLVVAGGRYACSPSSDRSMHVFMYCLETNFWRQVDFSFCVPGPPRLGGSLVDITVSRPIAAQPFGASATGGNGGSGNTAATIGLSGASVPPPGQRLNSEVAPIARWMLIGGAKQHDLNERELFDASGSTAFACSKNCILNASENVADRPVQLSVGAQLARLRPQSAGNVTHDPRLRLKNYKRSAADIEARTTKLHKYKSYNTDVTKPIAPRHKKDKMAVKEKKYKNEEEQEAGVAALYDKPLAKKERDREMAKQQEQKKREKEKKHVEDWDGHFHRVYFDACNKREEARDYDKMINSDYGKKIGLHAPSNSNHVPSAEGSSSPGKVIGSAKQLESTNDQLYYKPLRNKKQNEEKEYRKAVESYKKHEPRKLGKEQLQSSIDRLAGPPPAPLSSGQWVGNIAIAKRNRAEKGSSGGGVSRGRPASASAASRRPQSAKGWR